jgi:hypothetical protein
VPAFGFAPPAVSVRVVAGAKFLYSDGHAHKEYESSGATSANRVPEGKYYQTPQSA